MNVRKTIVQCDNCGARCYETTAEPPKEAYCSPHCKEEAEAYHLRKLRVVTMARAVCGLSLAVMLAGHARADNPGFTVGNEATVTTVACSTLADTKKILDTNRDKGYDAATWEFKKLALSGNCMPYTLHGKPLEELAAYPQLDYQGKKMDMWIVKFHADQTMIPSMGILVWAEVDYYLISSVRLGGQAGI